MARVRWAAANAEFPAAWDAMAIMLPSIRKDTEDAREALQRPGWDVRVLTVRTAPRPSAMTTRLYYLWFLTVILAFMLEFLTPRVLALLPPY